MIKRVYIEITNTCNLSCEFCLPSNKEPKVMDVELFEDIIKDVKQYTDFIYLHIKGEPTTHPMFNKILNICDQNEMKVQLVTNGSIFNKDNEIINHKSLRKISFSVQSLDYQNIDVMDYYNHMFNLIQQLKKDTYCEIRFWAFDSLKDKSKQLYNLIKENYPLTKTNKQDSYKLDDNVFIYTASTFKWPSLNDTNSNTGTCLGAINMLGILADGTIVPCCLDGSGIIDLGNIKNTSLKEVFSSKRYINMVNDFKNNKVVEPLCQSCTYRNRFNK